MSDTSNTELSQIYDSFVNARAIYAVAALVCFEHLITFKYEVDFLWKRKWSAATWIFVSNRYFMLASVAFQTMPAVSQMQVSVAAYMHIYSKSSSCDNSRVMNTLSLLFFGGFTILPLHVFAILRIFALLQDHPWRLPATWALVAFALTVLTITEHLQFATTWIYVNDPIFGSLCLPNGRSIPLSTFVRLETSTYALSLAENMAAGVVAITMASLILVIVIAKTARQVRQAVILGFKTTLSEVLLRDGSLFFVVIVLQDLYIIISTVDNSFINWTVNYAAEPILAVLTPLLLSRLIINLRQIDSPGTSTSADHRPSRTFPNFRIPTMDDVVGNLGEPLDFGERDLDDDDDAQDIRVNADADADQQDAASASRASGGADVEAASPSRSGSGTADAYVLRVDGILEELRLSPTLPA